MAKIINIFILCGVLFFCVDLGATNFARQTSKEEKNAKEKNKSEKSKEGLALLMEISKEREKQSGILKEQTQNYNKLKNLLYKGIIKQGDSYGLIKTQAGEPSAVISGDFTGEICWMYRPSSKDIFAKDKVYLFFDEKKNLSRWEIYKDNIKQ
ncbi:hypothetical protein OMAG_000165 [Candidatus Omnitrophus magneticus]|uniref:Uncharacterized protein n=1 Tax=Candidatus Omnitrophus magneticus TaxID=1609969 RepID=A0A0F0CWM7_9BACT|nr:hypothetical protein OMAG_000165 [Candidatus Omnitrophus magneticus]